MAQLRSRLLRPGPDRGQAAEPGPLDRAAFRAAVLAVVARIPEGRVASYVQVARMAGWPKRPRQVGMVLKGLPEGSDLPWHRVLSNHGHIPSRGRWWGAAVQAIRLREEGVEVDEGGNLDIEAYRWDGES